jgi:hypothetical protein
MRKFKFIFAGLAVVFFYSCSSTQVGLKENWIDERDMIALVNAPVTSWMQTAGRPTLVEISGDTGIYYYNFRPTMYATTIYDSSFFKTGTKTEEVKPSLANAVEVWGSRKNLIQIKVVNDIAVSAIVFEGPDKKTFIRDLNGDLVLDSKSGFAPNYSVEQKFDNRYNEFIKAYSSLASSAIKTNVPANTAVTTTNATLSSGLLPEASLQASPASTPEDTASVAAPPNPEEAAHISPEATQTLPLEAAPDAAAHATHEPHPAHAAPHATHEPHPAAHAEPHPAAAEPAPAGSHHSNP